MRNAENSKNNFEKIPDKGTADFCLYNIVGALRWPNKQVQTLLSNQNRA